MSRDPRLDALTREYTAFMTFAELVAADYSPTLIGPAVAELADAFDQEMEDNDRPHRAWRGRMAV